MKKDLTQEEIPVWVVDDDEVRYSIRFALATHGIDARTYASGEDFFNLVETDQPGCLVVDLTMPGMSGIEVLKRLRDLDSPIKVIVLSGHGTIRTAVEAMENGAISFMEKPVDPDDLLVKINAARDASLLEVRKTRVRHMLRQFSKRETQIFDLVCQGLKNGEIAEKLFLSTRTVESHRANITKRLEDCAPIGILYELARTKLDTSPVQFCKLQPARGKQSKKGEEKGEEKSKEKAEEKSEEENED